MKKFLIISMFLSVIISIGAVQISTAKQNYDMLNRQGCCSYHGGVCGCFNGRAVCCDGSTSPSCGC